MGAQDPGRQFVENAMPLVSGVLANFLVAMFQSDESPIICLASPSSMTATAAFDRDKVTRKILAAFEVFRKEVPPEMGWLSMCTHCWIAFRAVQFCKDVERFRLFYCEDLFAPEESGHYKIVRQQCTTPLAIGELWNNPHE